MAMTVVATATPRVVTCDSFEFLNDTGSAINAGQHGLVGNCVVHFDRDIAAGAQGTARFAVPRIVYEHTMTTGADIAVGAGLTITAGLMAASATGRYVALPSWNGSTYGGAAAADAAYDDSSAQTLIRFCVNDYDTDT